MKSRKNGKLIPCKHCGIMFYVPKYKIQISKYCSLFCKRQGMKLYKGHLSWSWRGGKIKRNCKICNKVFYIPKNFIVRNIGNMCSRDCRAIHRSINFRGDKCIAWKGGNLKERKRISEQNRRGKITNQKTKITNNQWSNIKKIYNFTCPACNRKEPNIKLTIDHKQPLSLYGEHAIKNIQPLCKSCNSKKHNKVISWTPDGHGYELTDMKLLVKTIIEGKVPIDAIQPNDIFLAQKARDLKKTFKYGGVVFYSETKTGGARK